MFRRSILPRWSGRESKACGSRLRSKSITLQEIIDPRVDSVAGDPGRLQQVVWNLVSNAVKFTPNGGKIQVRVERINSHVEIIVADTGQGIEPAALGSVFDRFWQADGTAQSKHGVGLGLSIVKEIVSLHGGTVVAHSEGAGKGSTFTVRLPLPVSTIPSLEPRRHPTVTQIANAASAPRLDGLSILVVDDEPDASDALKNLLGSLGASVAAATSAQAALATLKTLTFRRRHLRHRDAGTGWLLSGSGTTQMGAAYGQGWPYALGRADRLWAC